MENELKKRAKFHRKRQKGLPALSTLNPNAGNVEYNVAMFNHMNTPAGGFTNNPISGPMGGDVSAPAASGGMGEALATKIEESAMTREQMISELQKAGKRFYFPKYTDGQIYNMYMKYVVNAPKVVDDTIAVEQEPEVFEEKPTCPDCGTRLTDGGYCPKCYDGEEDMDEMLTESTEHVQKAIDTAEEVIKKYKNTIEDIINEYAESRDGEEDIWGDTVDEFDDDSDMLWEYHSEIIEFLKSKGVDSCIIKAVRECGYFFGSYINFDYDTLLHDIENLDVDDVESCDLDNFDNNIDEMLTEGRHDPYWTPYGYRAAAKVITGSAPEYYYHLKEIEMDTGDGIKLAKYAVKKGLPVMVDIKSDPDYPEFYLKDGSNEYHWNDYFYPYGTAHLTSKDYVPYTGQDLNTLYDDIEAAKVATYDDNFDMSTRSLL